MRFYLSLKLDCFENILSSFQQLSHFTFPLITYTLIVNNFKLSKIWLEFSLLKKLWLTAQHTGSTIHKFVQYVYKQLVYEYSRFSNIKCNSNFEPRIKQLLKLFVFKHTWEGFSESWEINLSHKWFTNLSSIFIE